MTQLQQITLQSQDSKTKIYIESHQQDIYLSVKGWLSPALAKKLISQLQDSLALK